MTTTKAKNHVDLMKNMVNKVLINGKEVYVVVPNIKQFKNETVERMTVRPNKRRTPEKRFHWLVHTFVRKSQNLSGRHLNVHLLGATDKDTLFRTEKGHFITLEKVMTNPEAVPIV